MAATPDWEIVIRFYAALHFIETYFEIFDPPAPANHFQREGRLNNTLELAKIPSFCRDYRRLWDLSKQVRYDSTFKATAAHLQTARAKLSAIEVGLLSVRPALADKVPTTHASKP